MDSAAARDLHDQHEARISHVEAAVVELKVSAATQGVKLETIENVVRSVDRKLDVTAEVAAQVRELKRDSDEKTAKRDKRAANSSYFMWTALAAVAADVILKIVEHFQFFAK